MIIDIGGRENMWMVNRFSFNSDFGFFVFNSDFAYIKTRKINNKKTFNFIILWQEIIEDVQSLEI